MMTTWPYLDDVTPYAFGPAYTSEAYSLKQAALRYLAMYLNACYELKEIENV